MLSGVWICLGLGWLVALRGTAALWRESVFGWGQMGGGAYGITAVGGDTHAAEKREEKGGMRLIIREIKQPKSVQPGRYQRWSSLVAAKWNHAIQILALVLTAVLLVLILNYENTSLDTAFEAFMDNQSFGVHILFATFGIAISAFWDYLFSRTSTPSIHHRLATRPEAAHRSILLAPPAHIFSCSPSWLASSLRHPTAHDLLSLAIVVATLLAKFTPIMLSNVSFSNIVTWKTHESCTRMAVAVLAYMVLVLIATIIVPSPGRQLPVKPETITGCLYYLCNSDVAADFEGLATLGAKERDKLVGEMGRRFVLRGVDCSCEGGNRLNSGESVGVRRVGVVYL